MSFWNDMSFGEKLLGIAALGTGVGELATGGELFAGLGADSALGGLGGAIDSGAQAIGSGISGLFSHAPAAAADAVSPTGPVTGAVAGGANAAAAPSVGYPVTPSNMPQSGLMSKIGNSLSSIGSNLTDKTGTFSNGYNMGFAGQAGVGLGGLALGNAAIQASNKQYGTTPVGPYTGVGSNLTGAQGVPYLTRHAAGGLMGDPGTAPMAYNRTPIYNNATSTPMPQPVMHFNQGGVSDLGSYSDGGRMLKGPGDGMSDDIPATINNKQPARLANDEFVVPADVVSHLGNGSSDAGAKKLYSMMDRVRRARTGSPKQAKAIHPDRYMPG